MSSKKKSASQELRAVGYLKPCDHKFINAYSKVHDVSKSSVVEDAVHKFIQSIPVDVRTQILNRANSEK